MRTPTENIQIVSSSETNTTQLDLINGCEFDPSFLKQNNWLERPPVDCADLALRNLTGKISRNHRDIYSMVKRIYLLKALNEKNKLVSAVFDLFYCLQDKGKPLKGRIIHSIKKQFSEDELQFFSSQNISNNLHNASNKMLETSLLSEGSWGHRNIIRKKDDEVSRTVELSPLIEAKELLNQGEISEATNILEKCLLESPHDKEVSDELFLIYRHMRDVKSIRRMISQLEPLNVNYLNAWRELEEKLQSEASLV